MSSVDEQIQQYDPIAESRRNTVEALAGFFAAAALFSSLVALAYHPVPISVGACLLALVASGMSVHHRTLCFAAVLVSSRRVSSSRASPGCAATTSLEPLSNRRRHSSGTPSGFSRYSSSSAFA